MIWIVDGPWACYVCAVFGETKQSWEEHFERMHPRPVIRTGDDDAGAVYLVTREMARELEEGGVIRRTHAHH